MDATTLAPFRRVVYRSFARSGDALFELVAALLTHPGARSFVELSEAPSCRRRWCSGYAALRDGRVDRAALRRAFAAALPAPPAGGRLVLGLDSSPIHRPAAHTCPDRTLVYCPNLPPGARPARPGWRFSAVVARPEPVSSWTYVLDNQRIASAETATTVGAAQVRALLPLLPARPVLVADGHHGCVAWVAATAALPGDQLLRTRRERVLRRPAPPRAGQRGAPRKDGPRFQGSDPATHGAPDGHWDGGDARGQRVSATWWAGLHRKACRQAAITAIRVVRHQASGPTRAPREAWFRGLGGPLPPPALLPRYCGRRFGIEHGDKFQQQALLWDAPRVRTPEQFARWSALVAVAHHHLALARSSPSPPAPGKRGPSRSPRSRSGARCRAFCPRWARRPPRHDHAGNRPAGGAGRRSGARRPARSSAKPPNGAPPDRRARHTTSPEARQGHLSCPGRPTRCPPVI